MITRFLDWIKRPFSRGSLRAKLIIFFFVISLIPLTLVGVLAYYLSQNALRNQAFDELESVRDLTAQQIQLYFEQINSDVRLTGNLPIVNSAMLGLMNVTDLETIRELGFLGRPDLNETSLATLYSIRHSKYHPFFTEVVGTKGYLDIFLVDLDGNIIYTQAKHDDFATNLIDGPYRSTELAQVFNALQNSNTVGEIYMTDHVLYPTIHEPLSFVGTPIIDETLGQIGVLIYAIPLDQVAELVQNEAVGNRNIRSYLVGQDRTLRSASGFYFELIDTSAVHQGLEGITGREEILNDKGEEVFSAYQPIEVAGQKWVLLIEEFKEDALAPATRLRNWMLFVLIAVGILAAVIGLLVGSRITSPISQLTEVAREVTGGNLTIQAEVTSQDETGQLSEAFNTMTTQLRQSIGSLESRIQERTAELALSMEVGQRSASIRDLNVLLPTVTEFIWDQFNLYYTQVFLFDDVGENLILRAGAGRAGQQMLARGDSISIKEYRVLYEGIKESLIHGGLRRMPASYYSSIIARAAVEGESVLLPDTASSDFFKPDPLLPETRSELAIPLIVEDRVVGVLDMQDNEPNTFTQENLTVFSAMAVQLAISIDSARQWALAQEAQQRAEKAIQQLTREAWSDRLVSSWGEEGFMYDLSDVKPLSDTAWSVDKNISVPLVVQDQAIGQLNVSATERNLTDNEQALLQSVAQQLAQKAENLRLFEATQQRATREQIARRIIDKVRASRNIETALQTAAEELNRALGTAKAVIDLQVTNEQDADNVHETEDADTANSVEPSFPANGKEAGETPLDLDEDME